MTPTRPLLIIRGLRAEVGSQVPLTPASILSRTLVALTFGLVVSEPRGGVNFLVGLFSPEADKEGGGR